MKKILSIVLALSLALSLCVVLSACGEKTTPDEPGTTSASVTANGTEDTADAPKLRLLDTAYAEEEYAICVAKENTALLDAINAALAELDADGTIDEIIGKYISSDSEEETEAAETSEAAAEATEAAEEETEAAEEETEAAEEETKADEETEAAEEAEAPAFTTKEEGVLIMATNATFPPYEYVEGEDATILGIDAELAALIAEKLGLTLRIENVEFDSIIGGVQTGKYDMGMAGMTVTEERLQNVNFSTPYTTAVQSVIVKSDSAITSIDDIVGDGSMKIGVQQGTTGAIYAEDDYGAENIINYKNGPDAVQALLSGKVDCVIIDNEPAKAYVASVG